LAARRTRWAGTVSRTRDEGARPPLRPGGRRRGTRRPSAPGTARSHPRWESESFRGSVPRRDSTGSTRLAPSGSYCLGKANYGP
jgi:hypothetical protein